MASKRSIIMSSRAAISLLKSAGNKSTPFSRSPYYNVTSSRFSGMPYNGNVRFPSLSPLYKSPVTTARTYCTFPTEKARKWSRPTPMTLTYYTFPTEDAVKNLSSQEIKSAFRSAFARWSEVIPVDFSEVEDSSKADIKIGFYGRDSYPFDREDPRLLAYGEYPEDGNIYMNAGKIWAVDFQKEKSSNAYDLETIAVHEIGHVLGLTYHSEDKESVMYPTSGYRRRNVNLTVEDAKRVQELYGSNLQIKLYV